MGEPCLKVQRPQKFDTKANVDTTDKNPKENGVQKKKKKE